MLPLDGLSSIVFHGPSPLWCVASGNVWFDHRDVNQGRCFHPRVADRLFEIDYQQHVRAFDWDYWLRSDRTCLRLTPEAFNDPALLQPFK